MVKPLLLVLSFVGVLVVYQFTPLSQWLSREAITATLAGLGVWAPLGYLVLKAIFTAVGVPASLLTVVSGALFGAMLGAVYSIIGATVGAMGAFLIARYLARDWAQSKFAANGRLASLNQGLERNALWFVLSTRLTPLLPFNVLNTLFGLTRVSLKDFTLGTVVGIIPGTLAYTWLGASGQEAFAGGSKWGVFGALVALALLSLLPVLLASKKQTVPQGGDF
ncbi:TVP38/TMEM64 family protein [Candidatus Cyanaurora vandensis]|uniref:TVP38/TMEM64 family protein n=1 Tax=Candidatus Cyanaurora vandensis TaxID=2714958 RepID=UPI0025797CE8|nr:TVP38/TMEM64 family protein [Candidatus Cyanaurora vandensis]